MIAPARRAAIDALALVDSDQVDLGAAVARVRPTLADDRDRALLLELVAGTLRMRGAIDYQLAARVNRPLSRLDQAVLRVLRLGAFQLIYLSRLPPSAIINDAVELTRRSGKSSAAGLVNAVLRALSKDRQQLVWPEREQLAHHLATVHSHPRWLVERWLKRFGLESTESWLVFNNAPAPLCLAVNRLVTTREALIDELSAAGITATPTRRAVNGLEVDDARALHTPAFAEGRFVLQDEASQLIAELADATPGATVLDLCASPGGKTVALAGAVGAAGSVTACDVRPNRLRLLARTLERCRIANANIVHVPASGGLPFRIDRFDLVLIDAPCSGLGTIRRDPDIRWRRSEDDLGRFALEQRDLLNRAAPLV
ncbi:MAG TPA: transcription antitermination factor NusB, partial [Vicinamibacterales bacterium]|nr:transcription antitermination factor NusB [Vicinamibacterales bacterium]